MHFVMPNVLSGQSFRIIELFATGLVVLHGISTLEAHLKPNPVYTNKQFVSE